MSSSERTLQVGIVGLGHLHPRLYMPLFEACPLTKVVAVTEANPELRNGFCRDYGLVGYAGVEEMLKAHKLDVAAVFLPHADCPAAAETCARAGVHLMVEKPMAVGVEGAQRIVQAACQHRVKLTTGYCWRMHPAAREFKALIQEGIIGQPVGAEGRCAAGRLGRYIVGHSPWMLQKSRSGGGPMYNLGVHWIDLFRWMLDDEVIEAAGRNVKVNTQYDIEDNSFAHLRFSRGTIAALDISYTVPDSFPYGRDLYLSMRGTQGVISWSPAYEGEKDVLFVCSDHAAFAGSPRRSLSFELTPVKGYSGVMGMDYVRDFAEAVLYDRPPAISGEDGVAALKVVEAVYRSAEEKRWVAVAG